MQLSNYSINTKGLLEIEGVYGSLYGLMCEIDKNRISSLAMSSRYALDYKKLDGLTLDISFILTPAS